jgi:alkanesulfonate monooxygenase SsuD/methylene tetrahydromethanopterin reductase-like flavin-dependent oxidoreductase (luciferase family)
MLDQMSRGRLMIGVGKGISHIETGYYGVDYAKADRIFAEAMTIIRQALTQKTVDFEGEFFRFKNVPMELAPFRQPHPPLWYGAPNAESVPWAASLSVNVVSLGPAERARAIVDRYRKEWAALKRDKTTLPKIGVTRHIVVADSDTEAKRIAQAAYPRWRNAMEWLWQRSNVDFVLKPVYPMQFDELDRIGHGVAGSPTTVRDYLAKLQRDTGVNYVLCQMVFGDMNFADANHSIELFGREVRPQFA